MTIINTYKNTDKAYGKKLVKRKRIIPHTMPVFQIGNLDPIDHIHAMPEIEEYEEYE